MHALFQRHPLASKLLGHFSKCLRCTYSIYPLAPHSLQSFSLRSLASDFVNASFSRSPNLINHLAVPICAHFPPFFCGAWQVRPGILLGHSFLYLEPRLSLLLFQRFFFRWFFFSFLPASFLGFAFSTFSKADAGLFSAFSRADAGLFNGLFPYPKAACKPSFSKIPFAQAFFWQCTLQQRKCLFFFGVPAWLSSNTSGKPLPAMETSLFPFFSFLFESSAALPFPKEVPLGAFSKASGISSSFKPCCTSEKSSLQSLAAAAVSPFLPSFLTWKRMQEVLSILRLAHTWPELEVSFSSGLSANRLISAVLTG